MIKAYIDCGNVQRDFGGRSTRQTTGEAYLVNVIIITILTVLCSYFAVSNVDLSDPALLNVQTELQK